MFHGLEVNGAEIASNRKIKVKTGYSNANLLDSAAIAQLVEDTMSQLGSIDV
jgi:3-hydroxybutyrate dehydrogenase